MVEPRRSVTVPMLKIRRPQIEALTNLSRRRLVAGGVVHLRDAHPERWAEATDEVAGAWVERRLARGLQLGLVEEVSLLRHLEVASLFDERFADSDDAIGVLHNLEELQSWPEPMELLASLYGSPAET
ncbi:hypothetical protein OV203_13065 [Nannocystis sp. ILAH1]|uniref:hypothetical protein n=2 Tax=unclassified Nannocystis TaxID=2627009 RepID=UPI00226D586A|nr:hypothetical protein [Nannocystis sp. ILAH1]MCY0988061.1 hypothetical protein [Nannocystis sp. ILAH1]